MRTLKQLEADVVWSKAAWRKALADDQVAMEGRRKARQAWRKAIAARDRMLMLLLKARSNRRDVGVDRRKSGAAPAPGPERRKSARGRREG